MIIVEETDQFARIAREAYRRMIDIESRTPEVDLSNYKTSDKKTSKAFATRVELLQSSAREGFITIVFSSLAVEALINRVGITGKSSSHFNRYLDKLDLCAKWVIVPEVANSSARINKGGNAFQRLTALVKDRNRLVHSKARHLHSIDEIRAYSDGFRPSEAAANAIATLDALIEELGSPITDALR